MTTNADTLDPNEIRALPVRRDLPYNGLTREQVSAIGFDPDEVETNRVANNQARAEQRKAEETRAAVAALEAAESGDVTYADAAEALRATGFHNAYAAFVQHWHEEDSREAAIDAIAALSYSSAEEYAEFAEARDAQERSRLEREAEVARQQLRQKNVEELQNDVRAFRESIPGGHLIGDAFEHVLISDIRESGEIPSSPEERQAAIESALRKSVSLGDALESNQQQAEAEWRALRKQNRARDGLMTQADIDRAKAFYIEGRMKQLNDEKMIDLESLKAQPSADEESAALTEKYRSRQEKSDDFHRNVADIEKRSKDSAQDRGATMSAERKRYKEALARAEEKAAYGEVRTTETAPSEPAKSSGYGPDGTWPDELGPVL